MMDGGDVISLAFGVALISIFVGILIGFGVATPDTLENGCITHNSKLYCEPVEVVK